MTHELNPGWTQHDPECPYRTITYRPAALCDNCHQIHRIRNEAQTAGYTQGLEDFATKFRNHWTRLGITDAEITAAFIALEHRIRGTQNLTKPPKCT